MQKKTEQKNEEEKYDFTATETDKKIDALLEEKQITNEKEKHYDDVHILDIAKNPPEKDYMKVELKKAVIHTKNEDEQPVDVDVLALPLVKDNKKEPPKDDPTVYVNCEGDKMQAYDTIIDIDLAQMAEAQVSDCASTIFPMLLDEYCLLAIEDKKAHTPEKRKEEFKWWWVLLLMMIIIPIILITITVFPSLMGG